MNLGVMAEGMTKEAKALEQSYMMMCTMSSSRQRVTCIVDGLVV